MADAEDDVEEKPVVVAADETAAAPAWADTRGLGATPPPAPASPPLDSMVVTPAQQQALQDRLVAIKKAQMASSGGAANETIGRLRSDRAQMEQAFKATALPPDALEPWDAKAKSREHSTDPVEAFGSLGSVFAMLASSFAGVPMEYALDAGAKAINAVHAGDDKAYERDFTSWKENTQLALKRHEIQRQAYNDSILKMNTNLNAGRSELELSARKFGDQQALAMLESGLDGDLNKLIEGRNKTALELQKTADEVWLQHEKTMDLKNDPRWLSGNPALKQIAMQEWQDKWRAGGKAQLRYDFTKDFIDKKKSENKDYTADDLAKWGQEAAVAQEAGGGSAVSVGTPKAQEIERRTQEYMKPAEEGGLGLPRTEAFDRATKEVAAAGKVEGKGESTQKIKAAAIREIQDKNPGMTIAEATRQYGLTTATPSGNKIADIDRQINMYENGLNAIDDTISMIDKHVGSVGVPGYATRAGERLGNIFGSNETDRNETAKKIQYLQTIAPRLLQDATSRGLKAEADKVNSIIAGLNFGDTTANTKRALSEIRTLWDKMKQDNVNIRRGVPSPTSGAGPASPISPGTAPASRPGAKKRPWENDPIISPRSELPGGYQVASAAPMPADSRQDERAIGAGDYNPYPGLQGRRSSPRTYREGPYEDVPTDRRS